MCGIAGILDFQDPPSQELLERIAVPLVQRGPDDGGWLLRGPFGLVHQRLSIIDLEGGRQPILNEDESLAIVCNGEIYNFPELRIQLEAQGHHFRTHSDSEVVLHLYEEEGPACVNRLNGMFAFAIADFNRQEFFLARDRFGQKPLCFAMDKGRFAFASLPSALLPLPWISQTINSAGLHLYFDWQCIPAPHTFWQGIAKLPPGGWLRWRHGDCETGTLASARTDEFPNSFEEAANTLRGILDRAVHRHLLADVPVGAFLSGGLDSSAIAAVAAAILRKEGQKLQTFSIGFAEKDYDEREYAAVVARKIGSEHHFLEVDPADIGLLGPLIDACGEPFADASLIPTALLAQFARGHVKTVLGGDGADELFGGYYRYQVLNASRRLDFIPAGLRNAACHSCLAMLPGAALERSRLGKLRRLLELGYHAPSDRPLALASRFPEKRRFAMYSPEFRDCLGDFRSHDHGAPLGLDPDSLMRYEQATYLPDDTLAKVDRGSMAFGLEVRAPYLDHEVADFALSLPTSFKMSRGIRKRILAEAFHGILPETIPGRAKMGFGVPLAHWFRGDWRGWSQDLILSGILDLIFSRPALEKMLREHQDEQADHGAAIYSLLVLALYLDRNVR
jgi:asparagine synthase (glutamine-hydrolysing)